MPEWFRVNYTAASQTGQLIEDTVDVLADTAESWATWRAIRQQHPEIDVMRAVDLVGTMLIDAPEFTCDVDPRTPDDQTVPFRVVLGKGQDA